MQTVSNAEPLQNRQHATLPKNGKGRQREERGVRDRK